MLDDNVGVVDKRSEAYFQTDESVLNSVLLFTNGVEKPGSYKLDKDPEAFFIHFTYLPKPWQMWNSYNFRHFDVTVEWAVEQDLQFPKGNKVPFSLKRKNKSVVSFLSKFSSFYMRVKNRVKKLF